MRQCGCLEFLLETQQVPLLKGARLVELLVPGGRGASHSEEEVGGLWNHLPSPLSCLTCMTPVSVMSVKAYRCSL